VPAGTLPAGACPAGAGPLAGRRYRADLVTNVHICILFISVRTILRSTSTRNITHFNHHLKLSFSLLFKLKGYY
jgi:hypothetical protein